MRGCSGSPGSSMRTGSPSRSKPLLWQPHALASGLSLSPKSETPSETLPDPRGNQPGWRPPRWLLMAMTSGHGYQSQTLVRTLTIDRLHRVNLLPWSPIARGGLAGMGWRSNWPAPGPRAPGWVHCTTSLSGPQSARRPGRPPGGGSANCSGRPSSFASGRLTQRPPPQSAAQNGGSFPQTLRWWLPTQ